MPLNYAHRDNDQDRGATRQEDKPADPRPSAISIKDHAAARANTPAPHHTHRSNAQTAYVSRLDKSARSDPAASPCAIVEKLGDRSPPRRVKRSEEHTSELQSRGHLVCRLLLEKKNTGEDHTAASAR